MSEAYRDELYQQVILEHNRHPKNFGKLAHATHQAEGFNPLCGDHYQIYLQVSSEGLIEDIAFEGTGCAISKSSASLMTQFLKGKSLSKMDGLAKHFQNLCTGQLGAQEAEALLGKCRLFSGVAQYPARVKCATLAWHTAKAAAHNEDSISTE